MKVCSNCKNFFEVDFASEFESPDVRLICQLDFPPLTEDEIIAVDNGSADFDENIAEKCVEYGGSENET
jgi:hypothetical protein